MDYEKEYKEALKRAKNLHKDAIDMDESLLAKQCEIIFPELKESEDERIRKELISFFSDSPDTDTFRGIPPSKVIAWLEKQSQKETTSNKEDEANKNNALYIFNQLKDRLCSNNEYDKDILGAIEYCIKNNRPLEKEHIAWLEKQEYTFEIKEGHWYKCVCDYMLNGSDLMFKNNRLYYCRRDWRLGGEIDERNVKDIGVNGYKSFFRPATNKEIEDWLEKQREQKRYTFKSIPRLLEMIEPTDRAKAYCQKLIDSLLREGYATDAKIVSDCLKQMNDDDDKVAMATMDEQKNQVEPKFKVGNWYQCTKDFFGKGVTFDKDTAYYCAKEGCLLDGCHIAIVKDLYDNFKLWTIQDVKDGDILAIDPIKRHPSSFVAIYKKQNEEDLNNFDSYCFVGFDGKFYENEYGHSTEDIHPATEEQRDLLFAKMKEDGYEWDFENKELKKIEDNIEQKSAWSEEDESILSGIIDEIEADRSEAPDYDIKVYDKFLNWLNSLKQKLDLVNKS